MRDDLGARMAAGSRIVVGWSDSAEGQAALEWAVHQALLTTRSVLVVHEIQRDRLGGGAGDRSGCAMPADTRSKLDGAVRSLADRFRELDLKIAIEVDDRVVGLVRWSSTADLLVLGAPPNPHPRMMGALAEHVAAAADSPVAWISGGWQPWAGTDRLVVVGATSTPAGRAAVRFAAGEAVRMTALLVAVVGGARGSADGRATLAHFQELAVAEPRLAVEVHWTDTDPAPALVAESRRAQILVVGTHHCIDRWSVRLGPVTEAVLRGAHCPVITVARLHAPAPRRLSEPAVQPG